MGDGPRPDTPQPAGTRRRERFPYGRYFVAVAVGRCPEGRIARPARPPIPDSTLSWATMRTITPLDLRRSLGAILDAASAGERVLIERDHRPIAMLVSVEDGRRLDPDQGEVRRRRLAALDRLAALATEQRADVPSGLAAADAIRQERERNDA